MKKFKTLIAILFIAYVSNINGQPAGTLDLTFNGTGKVVYDKDNMDAYNDIKVQSDGKIVAVGSSFSPTWSAMIEVTRYLTDGTFDPFFGTNGHFSFPLNIETMAYKCLIRDDGKIIICGHTTDYATYSMLLIQLDTNGIPDVTFGNNGVVLQQVGTGEQTAFALALQDDKKILVAGYAVNGDFRNAPVVLRFSETGVLDTSFGTNGVVTVPVTETDNDFSAVCVQSDGKILAAGHISNGLSWFSLLIARFDQNGNLDNSYGTNGIVNMNLGNVDDEFYDMQLTGNDESILTGFTVTQSDYYYHLLLMKFDVNGQPVAGFGNNGVVTAGTVPYSFGDALALQSDGKILICGSTGELAPGNNDWAFWRFNSDGSPDNDFGTNGLVTTDFFGNADEALGIVLHEDKIILAGKTRNAGNLLDFAVARYINDFNVTVPGITYLPDFSVSPVPVKLNGIVKLDYELKQPENMSVEIKSITGSLLMNLSIGNQPAGAHSYQFSLPSSVSEGVCFVRIRGSELLYNSQKLVVIN
jgi:uncharacterized delta-60 repeat protein